MKSAIRKPESVSAKSPKQNPQSVPKKSWEQSDTEIAEAVGITSQAVGQVMKEAADLPKLSKVAQSAADHATDFDIPIYNVWKQQTQSGFVHQLKVVSGYNI